MSCCGHCDRRSAAAARHVDELTRQMAPRRIVVCAPKTDDVTGTAACTLVEIVASPRGLTRRGTDIARTVDDCDALRFFVDDFIRSPISLRLSGDSPLWSDIVTATDEVVADGFIGPSLDIEWRGASAVTSVGRRLGRAGVERSRRHGRSARAGARRR